MSEVGSLWIFGYGSLLWKPGFSPNKMVVGHVEGLVRRFWQGNQTHRGAPDKPGRVATLIEELGGVTYGVAFQISGQEALDYLNEREVTLGGYSQKNTTFFPVTGEGMDSFPELTFIASEEANNWLGPAKLTTIADQVFQN